MSSNPDFDRWYAARKVRIIVSPSKELETFGNTLFNYHLISALADRPGKVRVREGRFEATQPLVIAPNFSEITADGLGEAGKAYLEFLRDHEDDMRILRYGYNFKSDNFSEQILTDSISAVTERVKLDVSARGDRFAAVLQGEDDPWDVALVELWRRLVASSVSKNIRELNDNGRLFRKD